MVRFEGSHGRTLPMAELDKSILCRRMIQLHRERDSNAEWRQCESVVTIGLKTVSESRWLGMCDDGRSLLGRSWMECWSCHALHCVMEQ